MSDYPDYTTLMQLIGSDITLSIDITAQSVGNITVDIAAQSIGNIEVDIVAQTIENFTIDINAQHVGVYLQPDWNVLQETDSNLVGAKTIADSTADDILDYTVPDGKTFYICQWGFSVNGGGGIYGHLFVKYNASTLVLGANGGYSGGAQSLTKPIAIAAGDHIKVSLMHFCGGNHLVVATVGGYAL